MFRLSNLLQYDNFAIQCHDNPDADAIASAFGIYSYLTSKNKSAEIVYLGKSEITKFCLLEMLKKLSIKIRFASEDIHAKTLVMVDCQYGSGNAGKIKADEVFVIDHHMESGAQFNGVINSYLGSCSTLVWDLLRTENFVITENLATALYYGLHMDTNSLAEIHHPLDKDMRDALCFNKQIIRTLKNSNLTLSDLVIAGNALSNYKIYEEQRFAVFKTEPCDPNILGFISDLVLQVDTIDVCVVYNMQPDGAKISVRSCTQEVMASEFAEFLTDGVGSGGGHVEKAGGFISSALLEKLNLTIEEYMEQRIRQYFNCWDKIYSDSHKIDINSMQRFVKRKIPVGYVVPTEIFNADTPVVMRTLEGDAEMIVNGDDRLIIGILGEVYPINRKKFDASYKKTKDNIVSKYNYCPTVRNKITGKVVQLANYIKTCVATGESFIYAKQLEKKTKVFTKWYKSGYMHGDIGDYLAIRTDDNDDVYIIRKDVFTQTYDKDF